MFISVQKDRQPCATDLTSARHVRQKVDPLHALYSRAQRASATWSFGCWQRGHEEIAPDGGCEFERACNKLRESSVNTNRSTPTRSSRFG